MIIFENNTTGIVTGGGTDAPSSGAVETWTVSTTTFPSTLSTGQYYHVADPALPTEKIRVTAITGTDPFTWTTTRGDESTTPVAHAPNFTVQQVVTADDFGDFQQVINVLDHAYAGGADPSGTNDSTAAFNAAVAALGNDIGYIYVPSGTYKLAGTVSFQQDQGMIGDGSWCTTLNYTGNATCINVLLTGAFGSGGIYGGRFAGFYINCGGAGADAVGFQIGDLQGLDVHDIVVDGANICFYLKNVQGWSEQGKWSKCHANYPTTAGVMFDTSSFDYGIYEFLITAAANANGVQLQNDCSIEGARFELRGNFVAGTPNTAAVLTIDAGNTAGTCTMVNNQCDIAVESGGTGTAHYSIIMGSANASSQFSGSGVMSFLNVTENFQGVSNPHFCPLGFGGLVNDQTLGQQQPGTGISIIGGTNWTPANALFGTPYEGNVYWQFGDVASALLTSGTNTLQFNGISSAVARVELYLQQPASGSKATVTWPTNVYWPGASTPTLSTAHSAVDGFRLTYIPDTNVYYASTYGIGFAA